MPQNVAQPQTEAKTFIVLPVKASTTRERARQSERETGRRAAEKTKDCWRLLLLLIRFGGDRKGMRTKFRTIKRLVASCQLRANGSDNRNKTIEAAAAAACGRSCNSCNPVMTTTATRQQEEEEDHQVS